MEISRLPAEARERRSAEIRAFLRSRRARLTPADVGMAAGGGRRTPGLRREEVAVLAGVGVSWYTWLERYTPWDTGYQAPTRAAGSPGQHAGRVPTGATRGSNYPSPSGRRTGTGLSGESSHTRSPSPSTVSPNRSKPGRPCFSHQR